MRNKTGEQLGERAKSTHSREGTKNKNTRAARVWARQKTPQYLREHRVLRSVRPHGVQVFVLLLPDGQDHVRQHLYQRLHLNCGATGVGSGGNTKRRNEVIGRPRRAARTTSRDRRETGGDTHGGNGLRPRVDDEGAWKKVQGVSGVARPSFSGAFHAACRSSVLCPRSFFREYIELPHVVCSCQQVSATTVRGREMASYAGFRSSSSLQQRGGGKSPQFCAYGIGSFVELFFFIVFFS